MGNDWTPPLRPAELTEQRLIQAFLQDEFPVGTTLPGERELANQLGVTRPTLREALQRLARDGWITIHQGKPTRVNDFWWDGNLNVLGSIVRYGRRMPPDFVPNLLAVRLALAPAYTGAAVEQEPAAVAGFLDSYSALEEDPSSYAVADWQLHRFLIRASQNPIYMLIFNGFNDFYVEMARPYFENPRARAASQRFYRDLLAAAREGDAQAAAEVAYRAMSESIDFWQERGP
jgi:GntR family negative regulator for fad regulon and positive regulator of fabA